MKTIEGKKLVGVALASALIFSMAAFAGETEQAQDGGSASGGAVTVTDMTGREITLDAPAERIVALTPADCEILYAIGAGDKLQ